MNTTRRTSEFQRFNVKCRGCKAPVSVLAAELRTENNCPIKAEPFGYAMVTDKGEATRSHGGYDCVVTCKACGAQSVARPVLGRIVKAKKCDARCLASTGHNCECSCGGKNHGAGHAA